MNIYEKKVLEKLGMLYERLRTPFRKNPISYTSIAFDWYPTELGKPYSITLVVKIFKISKDDIHEVKNSKSYIIEFDELSTSPGLKGASEAVGLIPKSSFYYDENKIAIFERNIADIITHLLFKIFDSGEKCIILQGPLFPKLAGRFGYRHFDRDKILAAITFQPEWLPQVSVKSLIRNTKLMNALGNIFFKVPNENKSYGCADIKSKNGLIESFKTWGIISPRDDKKMLYALDIFCQFPYDPVTQKSLWIDKLKIIKETFLFPGLLFENGEALWLPFGLACAYDRSIHYGYRPIGAIELIYHGSPHQEYLYYYERDVKQMYDSNKFTPVEVVGRRIYLYEAMHEKECFEDVVAEAKKIYKRGRIEIEKEITKAKTIEMRGNLLTSIIKEIFDRPDSDVTLWKKII